MIKDKDIKKAAKLLKEADAIIITAGAGMGVDSGLPDFRGNEGFWRAYPVAKRVGLRFEEMANPKRFETHPAFGWGFYGHRLNLYRNTTPHLGFQILLDIAKEKGERPLKFPCHPDRITNSKGMTNEQIRLHKNALNQRRRVAKV